MGLKLKYFVINPSSSDENFAAASRAALLAFANEIADTDKELANDLRNWVNPAVHEYPAIDYNPNIDEWPHLY